MYWHRSLRRIGEAGFARPFCFLKPKDTINMSGIIITEHNLFKPRPSKAETTADHELRCAGDHRRRSRTPRGQDRSAAAGGTWSRGDAGRGRSTSQTASREACGATARPIVDVAASANAG